MRKPNYALAALRHHVTGAIERGEGVAIVEQPVERQPKFDIGTRFTPRGKARIEYTVTDIYKTHNAAGELVRLEYLTTHQFAGQSVPQLVSETTIAMGL